VFPLVLLQAKAVSVINKTVRQRLMLPVFPLVLLQAKAVRDFVMKNWIIACLLLFPLVLLQAKAVSFSKQKLKADLEKYEKFPLVLLQAKAVRLAHQEKKEIQNVSISSPSGEGGEKESNKITSITKTQSGTSFH
jgi:hypothetical protein